MLHLAEQIREALSMFARSGTQPALIGGLAVVAHQVVRATKDVDFLVAAEAADTVHDATRTRDLDDIRALVRQHRATLNTQELQSYFALFHQLDLFHALLD